MSKKVFLQNGSYIAFTSKSVRFYSSNEEELGEFRANHSVVKILQVLMKAPGRIVNNEVLYEATRTVHSHEIKKSHPQVVSTAISKLPRAITANIINERNEGYKILLADDAEPFCRTKGELQDLIGDYYAFYLDPAAKNGEGKLLEAFIRIYQENTKDTKMAATAILRIHSTKILSEVAKRSSEGVSIFTQFEKYHASLDSANRDCFLVNGEVKDCGQNVVAITLQNKSGSNEVIDRWNIVLNLKDYMLDTRQRVNDDDLYRGGAGMMIGGWTKWGMIANQIVLIRKPKSEDKLQALNEGDILPFLRMENHVRLDETIDKEFYIWVMKKWPFTISD